MPPEDIRVERRGEVEILTIARPQARNALTFRTHAELEAAVRGTTARCLVVTAELFRTEDHREGVRAFLEKRAPRFAGR